MVDGAGRLFWRALGTLSLGCGAAGAVLPLLPTTPFLLLSAYAFARSSPRLHDWLVGHPRFGPLILDWQRHGAIARRTKLLALAVMAATPLVSWGLGVAPWILAVQVAVLSASGLFVATRPEGSSERSGECDG